MKNIFNLWGLIKPSDWEIIKTKECSYKSVNYEGMISKSKSYYLRLEYSKYRNKYRITTSVSSVNNWQEGGWYNTLFKFQKELEYLAKTTLAKDIEYPKEIINHIIHILEINNIQYHEVAEFNGNICLAIAKTKQDLINFEKER
jgi:hypothetical protein